MSGELNELTQLAAVAAASMENLLFRKADFAAPTQGADGGTQGEHVLATIGGERKMQDAKWGNQSHGRVAWAMILAEEIGEWATEVRSALDEEEMTPEEFGIAAGVLTLLEKAEDGARRWLEGHEWDERQQEVYDAEAAEKAEDADDAE